MKKQITLLLCILLILTGSVSAIDTTPIQTQSRGDILYVGGIGPGNYTQIQDAIDNSSDGDTVFVFDESSPYYEYLMVNASIRLIGENKTTTTLDVNGGDYGIIINYNNVLINNFEIINSKEAGILLQSNYNIISQNNFINNKYGVYVKASSYNIIHKNSFITSETSAIGIHVFVKSGSHNNINNNSFSGVNTNGIGIKIERSTYNEVKYNTITIHSRGIFIEYSSWVNISNNHVYNVGDGIEVSDSEDVSISNNTLNRAWTLINIIWSSNILICYNTIGDALTNGIKCYAEKNIYIVHNYIFNTSYGTHLTAFDCNINHNVYEENDIGINIEDSDTIIKYNTLKNNRIGILVKDYHTIVEYNNFLRNLCAVLMRYDDFIYSLIENLKAPSQFHHNYWGKPRAIQKPIFAIFHIALISNTILIPFIVILAYDKTPAQEPHDLT